VLEADKCHLRCKPSAGAVAAGDDRPSCEGKEGDCCVKSCAVCPHRCFTVALHTSVESMQLHQGVMSDCS
jgi:hypothetical protein